MPTAPNAPLSALSDSELRAHRDTCPLAELPAVAVELRARARRDAQVARQARELRAAARAPVTAAAWFAAQSFGGAR
jgi:hypothetical protein